MVTDNGRIRLVMDLRGAGIDTTTLSAVERVDRARFVDPALAERAWDDALMPASPTWPRVSRPLHAATYLRALQLGGRERVLQLPLASGYLAALLAPTCRWVYSIDASRTVRKESDARLRALRITNVVSRVGDPLEGWVEQAPFDRIVLDDVVATIPNTLLNQLRDGGSLLLALGDERNATVMRITRGGESYDQESILRTSFLQTRARN